MVNKHYIVMTEYCATGLVEIVTYNTAEPSQFCWLCRRTDIATLYND